MEQQISAEKRENRRLLILPPLLSGSRPTASRQRNGCSPQRVMPRRSAEPRERDHIVKSRIIPRTVGLTEHNNTLFLWEKMYLIAGILGPLRPVGQPS